MPSSLFVYKIYHSRRPRRDTDVSATAAAFLRTTFISC